jgi:flagellar basal body-associated protein FliL
MDNGQMNGNKSSKAIIIAVCCVMAAVLVGFCFIGVLPFMAARDIFNSAVNTDISSYNVTVTAEITEVLVKTDPDSDDGNGGKVKMYTPVYEYEYKGKTYSVTSGVSSNEKKYEVGDKAEVQISADRPGMMYDPQLSFRNSFNKVQHGFSVMFAVILIVPIIFAIVIAAIIIIALRKSRAQRSNSDSTAQEEYNDPNDDYRG